MKMSARPVTVLAVIFLLLLITIYGVAAIVS
jgi:hypothetical protein